MGDAPVPPSSPTQAIVFSRTVLVSPLSDEQRKQASLQLCRIHDRTSADAAAVQLSTLVTAGGTTFTHWSQFGNVRFWEKILPTIAAADYYGSISLKTLLAPLTTPSAKEQEALAPYIQLVQDFTNEFAVLATTPETVKDSETARNAYAAVETFTAQLHNWQQRVQTLPPVKGDVPFPLAVQFKRSQQQVARIQGGGIMRGRPP